MRAHWKFQKQSNFIVTHLVLWVVSIGLSPNSYAQDVEAPIVYSVERSLSTGEPGEKLERDYYISMGTNKGVKLGSVVEVLRRSPSYNLKTEKLHKDHLFPIARLKVIYAEESTAVARLEQIYSQATTPVLSRRAVLVGDTVRIPK